MKLYEVIQHLEEWAPPSLQENYDNAQLITGHPDMEINKALATLDCTEDVVNEAIKNNCNLIIAHHPIVFGGLKSLTGKNYVERTVIKAIRNEIAIYAIHTNLDNVSSGVNHKIGQKIGLQNLRTLAPKHGILQKLYTFVPTEQKELVLKALFDAGAGEIGAYDECSFQAQGLGTFKANENTNPFVGEKGIRHTEPETKIEVIVPQYLTGRVLKALMNAHPYEEVAYELVNINNQHQEIGSGMIGTLPKAMVTRDFLKHIAQTFNCPAIRHTALVKDEIKTVAFCGGAGQFLLKSAIAHQADIYITGDFKYHEFFDAEDRITILDIGHFESEQFTPELIQEYLQEKIPTFAVLLSGVNTNPVHYFIS